MPEQALCRCGCGLPAPIAKKSDSRRGQVKGQPVKYIRGHVTRTRIKPPSVRLIEKSVRDESTGCLRWTGSHTPKGYGMMMAGGVYQGVHRIAYMEWVGPIPDGLEIDHVYARGCRYRDCIEPSHLEAVTHRENTMRGNTIAAIASRKTHCPRGHELSDGNLVPSSLAKGSRGCLTCSREKARERHLVQRGES